MVASVKFFILLCLLVVTGGGHAYRLLPPFATETIMLPSDELHSYHEQLDAFNLDTGAGHYEGDKDIGGGGGGDYHHNKLYFLPSSYYSKENKFSPDDYYHHQQQQPAHPQFDGYESGHEHHHIDASIYSKQKVTVVPLKTEYDQHKVSVDAAEVPLIFTLKSKSSPLLVNAVHYGQEKGSLKKTKSVDAPHIRVHENYRPVISLLKEIVLPKRQVIQHIAPVVEEIKTFVAKEEKGYYAPEKKAYKKSAGKYGAESSSIDIISSLERKSTAQPPASNNAEAVYVDNRHPNSKSRPSASMSSATFFVPKSPMMFMSKYP